MRIFLMLLVLANLGLLAWQYWHEPGTDGFPAGRPDAGLGKGLVLVDEDASVAGPEAGEDEAAEPPAREQDVTLTPPSLPAEPERSVADEAAVASCATLGPFDALDAARMVQRRLNDLGSAAALRESGGQIRSGFWVYLPPFASRDAAKQIEDELRGKNVRDLFIVTGSEQRNAISLGLFSTPERADQRAAEIGRLGYAPRVAERFRDATVYWVDFVERPGDPLEPEAVGVMGAGDTLPEKRPIPCADIAEGAVRP